MRKRKIKNLYEAVIKTKVGEDQFTNYLIYLFQLFPQLILDKILQKVGLPILKSPNQPNCYIQYILEKSRPDAVISITNNYNIVIETKIPPSKIWQNQIENHILGSLEEFGRNKFSILIISTELKLPAEIIQIGLNHKVKLNYISWSSILKILSNAYHQSQDEPNNILIYEFLEFAKSFKLKNYSVMKIVDLPNFNAHYAFIKSREEDANNFYNNEIDELFNYIKQNSNKRIKNENDDILNSLPLFYRAFKISNWFQKYGAGYLVFDIPMNSIYILLSGYQSKKEKNRFIKKIQNKFKIITTKRLDLVTFSWEDEPENAIYSEGRFIECFEEYKKSDEFYNLSAFKEFFYFGYKLELASSVLNNELYNQISLKINDLIELFEAETFIVPTATNL